MHNKTLAPQRRSALRNHSRKAEVMRNKILCHSGVPAPAASRPQRTRHQQLKSTRQFLHLRLFQGQIFVWR